MIDLLLATLKPESAPAKNDAGPRADISRGTGNGHGMFERDLDATVRDRPEPRWRKAAQRDPDRRTQQDPSSENPAQPARASATTRDIRPEKAAGTEADSGAEAATGSADIAKEGDTTGDTAEDVEAFSSSEDIGPDPVIALAQPAIETVVQTDVVEDDPFTSLEEILGNDEDDPTEDAAIPPEVLAGPGIPAPVTANPVQTASSNAADPLRASGDPAGDQPALSIATDTPADDETADEGDDASPPAIRPGRSDQHASERALAVRAAFRAQALGRAETTGPDATSLADRLAGPRSFDGMLGDLRSPNAGQTVTLRITPVSAESRLSSVPVHTLAFHIARSVDKGVNRFDIRLDPPELGRVDVRLEVDGDSRVRVHLAVQRPEALDFLQRDARALERALANTGLDTDGGSISFSLEAGNQDNDHGNGAAADSVTPPSAPPIDETEIVDVPPIATHYVSSSGIDIRV